MYVYISESCSQEAKTYQIEEKIQELKQWVEAGDLQQFLSLFEIFEHPYYVKKGISYRYRLLVKMVDITHEENHYKIIVFFKIFLRGNKNYESLFIQAEKRGDILYEQQNIEHLLIKFVQNGLFSQTFTDVPTNHVDNDLNFLYQIKNNDLQLSSHNGAEYYQESPNWLYQIRPFLNKGQLIEVYKQIQSAFEKEQNTDIVINNATLTIQCQPNYALTTPSEQTKNAYFTRYLPTEVLLDKQLWLKTQSLTLPFYLNKFQELIVNQIFYQQNSFPLLINAPSNQGKTSLLAILCAHFLLQKPTNDKTLTCLFLCQPTEKSTLRQQIFEYIRLQTNFQQIKFINDINQLQTYIHQSCTDLLEFIFRYFDDNQKKRFPMDKFIDKHKFVKLWKKLSVENLGDYSASLCWFVIQHLIKGEKNLIGKGRLFSETLDNYSALNQESYQFIYQHIWKKWYEPLAKNQQYWDIQDLIEYAQQYVDFPDYMALLVDDAHQYPISTYQFLLQQNRWIKDAQLQLLQQIPLIFMGYSDGALPAQLYCWYDELKKYFYRLFDDSDETFLSHIQPINSIEKFNTLLNISLQYQRSKTNVVKFNDSLDNDALPLQNGQIALAKSQLFFVSTQQKALLHALIIQPSITLIVNSHEQDKFKTLKKNFPLNDWFDYVDEDNLCLNYDSLDNLPKKSGNVALIGFYHDDLEEFLNNGQEFAFLSFERRYVIDEKLNVIRYAMQQGLQKIFIIGDDAEFEVWQQLVSLTDDALAIFSDNISKQLLNIKHEHTNLIRATITGIDDKYYQYNQELEQKKQQYLLEKNVEQLFTLAEAYRHRQQYKDYYQLLLTISEFTGNYQILFEKITLDSQKIFVIQQLWQQQKADILLNYASYFPKSLKANLYALELVYDVAKNMPFYQLFSKIVIQYQQQYQQSIWVEFWNKLLPVILDKIYQQTNVKESVWQSIEDNLLLLKNISTFVRYDILAFCACQLGKADKAIKLWETAKQLHQISEFPIYYYKVLLQKNLNSNEKIICYIQLNDMDNLMSELVKQNLNELQLEYWDKILPYLQENHVLESALTDLLPHIHSQEILERLLYFCKEKSSENFASRVERFKTLQACLNSDWDVIIQRLEYYGQFQEEADFLKKMVTYVSMRQPTRIKKRGQSLVLQNSHKNRYYSKLPDELVDILYALNLNPNFSIITQTSQLQAYAEQPHIQRIYQCLREMFCVARNDEVLWHVYFPSNRSLCYLLEKSYQPLDVLSLYHSILFLMSKDNLAIFAMERLIVNLARFKVMENLGEAVYQKITFLETTYKKILKEVAISENPYDLPVLKTQEELVKSILALTDKENADMQKQKQAEIHAQKSQKLQQKQQEAEQEAFEEHLEEIQKSLIEQKQQQEETIQQDLPVFEEIQTMSPEPEETSEVLTELTELLASCDEESLDNESQNSADNTIDNVEMIDETMNKQTISADLPTSTYLMATHQPPQRYKAITELRFFNWRIFVTRIYQRINIEDLETGERWSLQLSTKQVQSDWAYILEGNCYHLTELHLLINVQDNLVNVRHLEYGIDLNIHI